MTQDEQVLFLRGKIESLKRQLSECKDVKDRCKTKKLKLLLEVKSLQQLIKKGA